MKNEYQNLKKIDHENYNIEKDCPFEKNSGVPFEFICETFEIISEIKGQNSKEKQKEILSRMFGSIYKNSRHNLEKAYYFCTLRLAPDYVCKEIGIGDQIIIKALSKTTGRTEKQIRESLNQIGDLGKTAQQSKSQLRTMDNFFKKEESKHRLSLSDVFDEFQRMCEIKGNQAELEKQSILIKLFMNSKGEEITYIIRWIQGNLKIGVAEASMQSALSKQFYQEFNKGREQSKEELEHYESVVKRAICEFPNQELIIQGMEKVGRDIDKLLQICHVSPGIPIKPMLAKPMKNIQMILKRFEGIRFTCEYKYDGLRGQIHYHQGKVDVYSRNLQNMNQTYPDIIQFITNHFPTNITDFVIDSEIVAIDTNTNQILPFQILTQRSKKNVNISLINIDVCIFIFDLLYLNGQSLLQNTLEQRRQFIKDHFQEHKNKLMYAIYKNTDNVDEIEEILQLSIKNGCEGLMIKTLDTNSSYEPAKRSFKWLKLKKDYLEGNVGDTFDLVCIGGFHGTGKRQGIYGSFLLACFNSEMEVFETTCKIGTGFSEEVLKKLHEELSINVIPEPLREYSLNGFQCDVWFKPTQVWEVKVADLQLSPVYTAAITDQKNKGIGMRFPRFIRFRDDKGIYDSSTSMFIYEIYKQQSSVNNLNFNYDDDEIY